MFRSTLESARIRKFSARFTASKKEEQMASEKITAQEVRSVAENISNLSPTGNWRKSAQTGVGPGSIETDIATFVRNGRFS